MKALIIFIIIVVKNSLRETSPHQTDNVRDIFNLTHALKIYNRAQLLNKNNFSSKNPENFLELSRKLGKNLKRVSFSSLPLRPNTRFTLTIMEIFSSCAIELKGNFTSRFSFQHVFVTFIGANKNSREKKLQGAFLAILVAQFLFTCCSIFNTAGNFSPLCFRHK